MVKNNPMVANDEDRFEKTLEDRMNIKKNIAKQSASFLFFGLFMASTIYLADSKAVIASVLTSLALIPFILSIYQTTIQSSYLVSLNLFEPLKSIPVKLGAFYLSGLIFFDLIPGLVIVLPSIIIVLIRFPLNGVIAFIWVIVGTFAGHTIGLFVFSYFGLKMSHKRSRMNALKNILKIVGMLLFMGLFFSLIYLQDYIIEKSQIITSFPVIYPVSIASLFEPIKSLLLIGAHLVVLVPIYKVFLKRIWEGILEPKVVSEGKENSIFRPSVSSPVMSLFKKDFKIISRKTSMLAGFLFPLYVILPQIFLGAQDGDISMVESTIFVVIVGVLTTAGADAILKVEGDSLKFLKRLPISKGQFALSKALAMSIVPYALAALTVGVAVFYNGMEGLLLSPYIVLLPTTASFATMAFLFRYKGDEIGIPELNFKKLFVLFLLVGALFGAVVAPVLLLDTILRYVLSYLTSVMLIFLFYYRLNR